MRDQSKVIAAQCMRHFTCAQAAVTRNFEVLWNFLPCLHTFLETLMYHSLFSFPRLQSRVSLRSSKNFFFVNTVILHFSTFHLEKSPFSGFRLFSCEKPRKYGRNRGRKATADSRVTISWSKSCVLHLFKLKHAAAYDS